MVRRLAFLLLTLCMCWQSLAYAGARVLVADAEEKEHAALHFEGEAHHHDDDGDVHQDESPQSVEHAMEDACWFAPALIGKAVIPLQAVHGDQPAAFLPNEPPPPFLRGLERPPKHIS